MEIILIAICAVICGADTWIDIEEFGNSRISWLKKFLKLENGIPSHDTFARVFSLLDPYGFQKCFQSWTSELYQLTKGATIAIDGKTLRRSHNQRNGKKALHIVHAWATESGILLGQKKTDEKSNEVTAIPELLDNLNYG